MASRTEVDRNLTVSKTLGKEDVVFYDVTDGHFQIDGVIVPGKAGEPYCRIPQDVAQNVNSGVQAMNVCTSGGRIRFKTDSSYVAVRVLSEGDKTLFGRYPHMPLTGSLGMDLYEHIDGKEHYVMTFVPPVDTIDIYESIIEFPDSKVRELTINMPTYSGLTKLMVGVSVDAGIFPCRNYKHGVPVVYYGSSITQGGCASRPGNTYESIISRKLDCNFINLGFSGWARAEQTMADYISSLKMSAFVMDYDHNAPTVEHLQKTHKPFFERIRSAQPQLPIIFVSRPYSFSYIVSADEIEQRFQIIKKTYDDAIAAGDRNVYLIDGREMVKDIPDSWGVDVSHPNDLGFGAMARAIGNVLATVL